MTSAARAALLAIGALVASLAGSTRARAGAPTPPGGVGAASPGIVGGGASSQLVATVTPGAGPTSTGLVVRCDLSSVGDPASQLLFDDGLHGDGVAADLAFGFLTIVADGVPPGDKSFPCTVSDAEARTGSFAIALTVIATCGDAVISAPETCDDGGSEDADGCDSDCAIEPGWVCEDVPSDCATICGDGLVVGRDECDDGGNDAGDGCDPGCVIELGWACSGAPSTCVEVPLCGDGAVETGEQCDDLDAISEDGCDATCTVETGYRCDGEPSLCFDDDGVAPHDLDGDHVHDALDNCPDVANPSQADRDDDELGDACDDDDDRSDDDAGCCAATTAPGGTLLLILLTCFALPTHVQRKVRSTYRGRRERCVAPTGAAPTGAE